MTRELVDRSMVTEYRELLDFAYELAEKASKLILDGSAARWVQSGDVEAKKNSVDLVTATDQAVEEMIKTSIEKRYPSHKFIGEESFAAGDRQELTDEYTWIIDPIDGTMNFVHSHPSVACSIGLAHKQRPVVGVIALPFTGNIMSAYEGGGAFMNRKIPLPLTGGIPQPLTRLRDCIIGGEWGSDRSLAALEPRLNSFRRLAGNPEEGVERGKMMHAIRSTGSSACNLAAVAAGQIDIYWDAGCWAWDVCAGAIILQETGGFFTGSKQAFENETPIGQVMFDKRFLCIRAVPDSPEENRLEIQKRLVKELYDVVDELKTT